MSTKVGEIDKLGIDENGDIVENHYDIYADYPDPDEEKPELDFEKLSERIKINV